jgi:phosphoribosylformylglycinamidine cyclo-ligase
LVGFAEKGFRSNGITDVRKAMLQEYGPRWHEEHIAKLGELSLGELVLQPSTIYCQVINELTGGRDPEKEPKAEIHGVANITGGGQPSKLGRMLEPSGYGAAILDPIEPPEIMLEVQKIRGFSDRDAYSKWHMGPGMVVATPEPKKVILVAEEHGIIAKEIGQTTKKTGILIENCGAVKEKPLLKF